MTPGDPAAASLADVERALRRRLLCLPDDADPLPAVMAVVGPVLEARDTLITRLQTQTVLPGLRD